MLFGFIIYMVRLAYETKNFSPKKIKQTSFRETWRDEMFSDEYEAGTVFI